MHVQCARACNGSEVTCGRDWAQGAQVFPASAQTAGISVSQVGAGAATASLAAARRPVLIARVLLSGDSLRSCGDCHPAPPSARAAAAHPRPPGPGSPRAGGAGGGSGARGWVCCLCCGVVTPASSWQKGRYARRCVAGGCVVWSLLLLRRCRRMCRACASVCFRPLTARMHTYAHACLCMCPRAPRPARVRAGACADEQRNQRQAGRCAVDAAKCRRRGTGIGPQATRLPGVQRACCLLPSRLVDGGTNLAGSSVEVLFLLHRGDCRSAPRITVRISEPSCSPRFLALELGGVA